MIYDVGCMILDFGLFNFTVFTVDTNMLTNSLASFINGDVIAIVNKLAHVFTSI